MNQKVLDEIYELEELIGQLQRFEQNEKTVRELQETIERLKRNSTINMNSLFISCDSGSERQGRTRNLTELLSDSQRSFPDSSLPFMFVFPLKKSEEK